MPVGVILLLFSEVRAGAEPVVRCNVSSWYAEPAFRAFAPLMVKVAIRENNVTYFNITPAPHTWPTAEARFSLNCKGQIYAALMLSRPAREANVQLLSAGQAAGLDDYESDLLRQHDGFGCLSLVVRDGSGAIRSSFRSTT